MNRIVTLSTLAALITVTAPFAGAEWYAHGTFEPDTYLDTSAVMPQDAPWTVAPNGAVSHSDAKVVYFNAFIKNCPPVVCPGNGQNSGIVNINVGSMHSRLEPVGFQHTFMAMFGVWTDCNFDGYIGLGEQGVREYRIEVLQQYLAAQNALRARDGKPALVTPARCTNSGLPGENVWNGQNGQGGWVTELIPIYGRSAYAENGQISASDKKAYFAFDGAVWADPGRPDDRFELRAISNCHGNGVTSTFDPHYGHTTGSMLRSIDCEGDQGVLAAYNGAVGMVDPTLRFDERSDCGSCGDPQPQNPENDLDFNPWERCWLNEDFACEKHGDHWDNTYIRAQDCESGSPVVNDIPAAGGQSGGDLYNLPDSNGDGVPDVVNPGGNIAGTYNRTTEEFDPSPEDASLNDGRTQSSNCNPNDDTGHGFYNEFLESAGNALTPGRNRASVNFGALPPARGNVPASARWPGQASGGSTDFGVEPLHWVRCVVLCASDTASPYWAQMGATNGFPFVGGVPANGGNVPPISRSANDPVNHGSEADLEQTEARYWTFYASIGDLGTTKGLVKPAGGTYGGKQCLSRGGYTNVTEPPGSDWRVLLNRTVYDLLDPNYNWECNKRLWNIEADGTWDDVAIREAVGGDHYDLRDVDCLDGTITVANIEFATSPESLRDPGDNQDVDPDTPGDQSTLTTRCRGPGQTPPPWA